MGFEKFGYVSFTSQTKVAGFVDNLEKGKLTGNKCRKCGAAYFPPRADCFRCLGKEFDWFEISGTGKVIGFTRANYAPTGFESDVPYTLALVEFNGVKVFGRISKEIKETDVKVGMELRPSVVELPNGQLVYEFVKS